jgi:hypothetical protein
MLVANHLNRIQAGKPVQIGFPVLSDRESAEFRAEQTAIILICMGFGLARHGFDKD